MRKTDYNIISAQVIGKEPGNWFDRFVIDKGLKDGIKGDTVIRCRNRRRYSEEGIVGRIAEVGDNWAKVISIVDETVRYHLK